MQAAEEGGRTAILSGGELTVTINGTGQGGPSREYALAMALALNGDARISAIACDTDGADGAPGSDGKDVAGAIVLPELLERARGLGLDPKAEPTMTCQQPWDYLEEYAECQEADETKVSEWHEQVYEPWTFDDLPMMKAWLEENSPALDLLGEAVRKPVFYVGGHTGARHDVQRHDDHGDELDGHHVPIPDPGSPATIHPW